MTLAKQLTAADQASRSDFLGRLQGVWQLRRASWEDDSCVLLDGAAPIVELGPRPGGASWVTIKPRRRYSLRWGLHAAPGWCKLNLR
jgi:hypothetical protein